MSEALHLWHSGFIGYEQYLCFDFEYISYRKVLFVASYMFEEPLFSRSSFVSIGIKRIIRIRKIIRIISQFLFELYTESKTHNITKLATQLVQFRGGDVGEASEPFR